ncbi:SPOR domain-containing protein [Paenibacillus sanguinis]|uniref:SPOR domain-containing protein n=1 Tax=Paenibacillus sanguinis TaxID=225906 RepID=UPI0003756E8D|nr:SPOR domain-containing protein [Paenibacillus sanguinis]
MNKAKMTFRLDGEGREFRPVQQKEPGEELSEWAFRQEGDGKNERPYQSEGQAGKVVPFSKRPLAEPLNQQGGNDNSWQDPPAPQYRAVETVEEWGDPFTDYTGMNLTVFPEGQERERLDLSPEEDEQEWREPHYSRPNRTSWWKVAGSLTGAIVTGALFGFVVLSLFNQEMPLPVPIPGLGTEAAQTKTGNDTVLPVMGAIDDESDKASGDTLPQIRVNLPEQTYYFLQYGVFSSANGVELAQEELRAAGVAAARDTVDEKRVYAGVSTDREQSKLLSGQLKAAGVHLILHEIALPQAINIAFSGNPNDLETFMEHSGELTALLSSTSASLLTDTEQKPLRAEDRLLLEQQHQLWTESVSAIRGKWSEEQSLHISEMEKAMNGAIEAMGEYDKSGAKALLWEVQNDMMRFILAEQALVATGIE